MIKSLRRKGKNNQKGTKNNFFKAQTNKNQFWDLKNIKFIFYTVTITLMIHIFLTIY